MVACAACWRRSLLPLLSTVRRIPRPLSVSRQAVSIPRTSYGPRLFSSSVSRPESSEDGHALRPSLPTSDSLAEKKQQQKLRYAVGKHLERLRDPWNIAQHVERTLRQTGDSRFDEVLLLVQTASKSTPVTVSWNHLIDHHFKMKRLRPAIKLFNEMKKRGQKPNQQTYTIIFRGCAENPHKELALAEAVRIYNTILRDSSVRPNLIHANAVLHVCVRAGDTDAMFALLDRMEENKQLHLDDSSYSTILQGMRLQLEAIQTSTDPPLPSERSQAVDEALDHCETVWGEIIRKWRKGKLNLSESLVCTMGRLLLLGRVPHQRNVFALLQQTMNLPRFDMDNGAARKQTPESAGYTTVFKPAVIPDNARVRPSTRTLDLVLQTTTKMRLVKVGVRYWQHLVEELGVQPDQNNWLKMLKLLQVGSSSSEAARFLNAMPPAFITPFGLRLAMSTCLRNMKNPSVLANAQDMLRIGLRQARKGPPDVKSLWLFLRVVNGRLNALSKENQTSWHAVSQEIAASMDSMWLPYELCANSVLLPRLVKERQLPFTDADRTAQLREVVEVAREMISATSKILPYIDTVKQRSALEQRRSHLNRHVVVFSELQHQGTKGLDVDESMEGKRDIHHHV